ncbi:MAG: hypothetical protein HOM11_00470 [Methylococcales bacterium]|jgi:hypothetical protein|nr:hypothetical protein [Methylococcales bacterium]MBT7443050.1 hypothetical protein [Methylococcales bacterium]
MSIQDFVRWAGAYSQWVLVFFTLLPLLGLVFAWRFKKTYSKLWAYACSVIIYLVSLPGMLAGTLVGYMLFFTRQNLLEVNVVLYILPIISMVAALVLIGKQVKFALLPGFNRLSGLMVLLAILFVILLLLYKLRILIGFFGSMQSLLILGVGLFFVLKWASNKAFGQKR